MVRRQHLYRYEANRPSMECRKLRAVLRTSLMEGTTMNRREAIRSLSLASGASLLASTPSLAGVHESKFDAGYTQAVTGTAPVKIRDIKTILTAPNRIRLVVVKIETTEAGPVGWGCGALLQRALAGPTAPAGFFKPLFFRAHLREIWGLLPS